MRQRTPSALKWVTNELAATVGEIERIDRHLVELRERRQRLEAVRTSLAATGAMLGAPALAELMPAVRVHRRYGGRGYLVDWLKVMLQAAGPDGVETLVLARLAEERFGLAFPTPQERQRFCNNSLARKLRKLADAGLAERLHDPIAGCGSTGRWRWKTPVSLKELQDSAVKGRC